MINVKHFTNELMSSNCYVVYDDTFSSCIVIDPGSERGEEVIAFIDSHKLIPKYIILTHEHTDHNWGVNSIRDKYKVLLVCSKTCNENIAKANCSYFLYYFDKANYIYIIDSADILIENNCILEWNDKIIEFIITPGHSEGSMCFSCCGKLFTGDTLMQCKPYIPRKGGAMEMWKDSVIKLLEAFDSNTLVYPGHGEAFPISDFNRIYICD